MKDLVERKELVVSHCPGDLQLADILTKVLAGPRHQILRGLLGLGPETLAPNVAAVQALLHAGHASGQADDGVGLVRGSKDCSLLLWAIMMIVQISECVGADDEDGASEPAPIGPELSLMMLMLTFSVLFIWESGKAVVVACCRSRDTAKVAALRAEADNQKDRRMRRQEAVRRAIVNETEGLCGVREVGSGSAEIEVPIQSYVHVQVEAPRPPPPRIEHTGSVDFSASSSTGQTIEVTPPPHHPPSSSSTVPPPPRPVRPRVEDSPTRREVAVQTVERRGLSLEEMQEIQVHTSSSRTPGVVHLFPECQALRGVHTHRRQFCRYCLQAAARPGI